MKITTTLTPANTALTISDSVLSIVTILSQPGPPGTSDITADQQAALDAASSPSAGNAIVTITDLADFGGGDMLTSVYDPTGVMDDAFDMDNMVEGATTKILTAAERTKLGLITGTNTGDDPGVTSVTGTAPVTSSGGTTPTIGIPAATATVDGYATSTQITKLDGIEAGADVTSTNETSHADVLVDGDIGVNVEAYDATILKQSDVDDTPINGATTAPVSSNWAYAHETAHPAPTTRDARNQVAGSYEPADATILKDADINVTVQGYTAALAAVTGTNTGDDPGVTSVGATAPVASSGGATPTISMPAATNAVDGYATAAQITAIEANTTKETNVSTNLSEGTATETTVDVNSSDGTNATLAAASTTRAGLLTKAKFDEIVANTANLDSLGVRVTNLELSTYQSIGVPSELGFGVGTIPTIPVEFNILNGTNNPASDNYGNYQYSDGSIMCWVPKFYYRVGHVDNPTYGTYGVNSVDIKGTSDYATTAEANAAGYALHRAFIDGGVEQAGFFVDKYMASKNALGTGFVASSIAGGLPLSTAAAHNPIADLTACTANTYYEAINAAHARDGIDGAVNADSRFFVTSRQIQGALALLSLAHGQAAVNATNCAWFDATYNFPKGCNNNALGDSNDGTVAYVSDGYSNCGKTGSGTPFAKTTHNGQACGVADLNGLMYEINLGMTCIATSKAITAVTNANPCKVTVVAHGLVTGGYAQISAIVGTVALNDKIYTVTVIDADNFTLDGVDSTAFGAYTSGGSATVGTFYRAADATEMRKFTAGNTLATDHWGATGVAAMMVPIQPAFETAYPGNGFAQRFGDAAGQVLAAETAGDPWELAGLGLPADAAGISAGGTNLFGTDYYYQYIRNELCLRSSSTWNDGTSAGVWALLWDAHRTNSSSNVGFRCATYPV